MVVIKNKNIAASTLAKLKNKSIEQKLPFQQILILFCQEEFLRKLSKSRYRENLVLKGGFLLYSISKFESRPTTDTDYLVRNYPNNIEKIKLLVSEIIDIPTNNSFIVFEIIKLEKMTPSKEYNGVRVKLLGKIGKTKTKFNLDFGIGDIVTPSPDYKEIPVILSNYEKPIVLTYSLESVIAEKLEIIISFMEFTGRMKDFYDIYYLVSTFDFEGEKVKEAIYKTLNNRKTIYSKNTSNEINQLQYKNEIQKRWKNFCKKTLNFELRLSEVIEIIVKFIEPPLTAIVDKKNFSKTWYHKNRHYEN